MRVSEVMALQNITAGDRPIEDSWVITGCPACEAKTALEDAATTDDGSVTRYKCGDCGAVALTVEPFVEDPHPTPNSGRYRLGDYVIAAHGGMEIKVPGS